MAGNGGADGHSNPGKMTRETRHVGGARFPREKNRGKLAHERHCGRRPCDGEG